MIPEFHASIYFLFMTSAKKMMIVPKMMMKDMKMVIVRMIITLENQ